MATTETSQTAPPGSFLPTAGRVALMLAVLLLLYIAYLTVRPVLVSILLAAALASLVAPLFRWVIRRLHGRRRLASFCVVVMTFVGV
ncbi:MAG: hypothetical protein ACXVCV_22055, partial [Polyangia bacterium]